MSLNLKDLAYRVNGQTLIHETNIELAESGFNILLGTTLAGKTTLMQLMAGLRQPSQGQVWFAGRDVTGEAVQKRNVSMVYQQFINYPNMSVFDNIASPLRVAGLRAKAIKERVGPIAELLRLSPYLSRRPAELSGGQQQRCAIARALVKDSRLILFDEPLANLDYKLREELRDELPRLFVDRDCTVVYATTEPAEALLLAGHTATMFEGRVTQYGPTSDVYRCPKDLLSATVFADPPLNVIRVKKQGWELRLPEGSVWPIKQAMQGVADGEYSLAVRAHHVRPALNETPMAGLTGVVQVAEISGSESLIHFDAMDTGWVSQAHGVHDFRLGQTVSFAVDVERAMLFDIDGQLAFAAER